MFGTLHQLLILMQINITQYVLVRIPRNEGLFDTEKVDMKHMLAGGLRASLLTEGEKVSPSINADGEGQTMQTDGSDTGGKLSLGQMLRKIKESQANRDDNFRA